MEGANSHLISDAYGVRNLFSRLGLSVIAGVIGIVLVVAGTAEGQPLPDETRGYSSRACGFDMDGDGVVGEPTDDCNVCDGVTADPDGDGTAEDLIYVNCNSGNDSTGTGAANRPYRTIAKALSVADGPGDGAEDIICARGTCSPGNGSLLSAQDIPVSGVSNRGPTGSWYHTRPRRGPEERDFRYPANPVMIVGWDTDDDGVYPPHDSNQPDPLVFEACSVSNCSSGTKTAQGFNLRSDSDFIELAHFTMSNYGRGVPAPTGGISMANNRGGTRTGVYVHDVVMNGLNVRTPHAQSRAALWLMASGARFESLSLENIKIDQYSGWPARGNLNGNYIRLRNFDVVSPRPAPGDSALSFKLWSFDHGEFLSFKFDMDPANLGFSPDTIPALNGLAVTMDVRDVAIRNNEYRNCNQCVDVGWRNCWESDNYCDGPSGSGISEDLLFDRQIFIHDNPSVKNVSFFLAVSMAADGSERGVSPEIADPNCEVGSMLNGITIRNSVFRSSVPGLLSAIVLKVGSNCSNARMDGVTTIENNTFSVPSGWGGNLIRIGNTHGSRNFDYRYYPQSYRINNNTFAGLGGGRALYVEHKGSDGYYGNTQYPSDFVANNNSYGASPTFYRAGTTYSSLSAWQSATNYDRASNQCATSFTADGYHLMSTDQCSKDKGANVTCTLMDVDARGRARSSSDPCDRGADEEGNGGMPAPDPDPIALTAPVLREAVPR